MASRSNGSKASRSSGNPGGGGTGERQRSPSHRDGAASSSSRRRRSQRGGAESGSRGASSSKSHPDVQPSSSSSSSIRRGYQSGRRGGMAAVDSIKSAGSRAMETVGEHPIPAALIGAGLAWLLLESRGIRPTEARLVERSREALGEVGHTIAEAAGTAGHAIADAVGTATETVTEGASALGGYASTAASAVGETTASGYEYSREKLGNLWERHPLAVSAAILSAGIAAGMMLPGTMKENTVLGGAARKVAKQVRGKGGELIEHGRRMAASAANAVRREGERQGLTPDEIGHKVKRVARSGRKAVTE